MSAAETPKYARKHTVSDTTMPIGMALWGFFTSSPVAQREVNTDVLITIKTQVDHGLLDQVITCCCNAVKSDKSVEAGGSSS